MVIDGLYIPTLHGIQRRQHRNPARGPGGHGREPVHSALPGAGRRRHRDPRRGSGVRSLRRRLRSAGGQWVLLLWAVRKGCCQRVRQTFTTSPHVVKYTTEKPVTSFSLQRVRDRLFCPARPRRVTNGGRPSPRTARGGGF